MSGGPRKGTVLSLRSPFIVALQGRALHREVCMGDGRGGREGAAWCLHSVTFIGEFAIFHGRRVSLHVESLPLSLLSLALPLSLPLSASLHTNFNTISVYP